MQRLRTLLNYCYCQFYKSIEKKPKKPDKPQYFCLLAQVNFRFLSFTFFLALAYASFQFQTQQFRCFNGIFHRQFTENFFTETVDN
jgi:hypothetical protein